MKIHARAFVTISLLGCMLFSGCESSQSKDEGKPTVRSTVLEMSTPQPGPSGAIAATAPSASLPSSPAGPLSANPVPSQILSMNEYEGWGMGVDKLLYTNNAGKTWGVTIPDGIVENDRLIAAAAFRNPFLGYAYYLTDANSSRLLASHRLLDGDGLPSGWETAVLPTAEAWETEPDVAVHNSINYGDTDYVLLTSSPALGQMNKSLYRTDNHGKSWTRVGNIGNDISGYPTGITFRVSDEGWITASYHGLERLPLFRTKDGGKTWTTQHVDIPGEFKNGYADTLAPVFDQENDNHGLFIARFVQDGKKTYVPYESHDGGDTWLPIKYRLTDVQDTPVYYFDDLIAGRAISTDGKTIYTMDTYNNEDWQKIQPNIALEGASQFYLRSDGYGWVLLNGHTKITLDGGATWNNPT